MRPGLSAAAQVALLMATETLGGTMRLAVSRDVAHELLRHFLSIAEERPEKAGVCYRAIRAITEAIE